MEWRTRCSVCDGNLEGEVGAKASWPERGKWGKWGSRGLAMIKLEGGIENFFLHDLHRSSVVSRVVRPVHRCNAKKHVIVPTGGS
jgi:hypothetical protein